MRQPKSQTVRDNFERGRRSATDNKLQFGLDADASSSKKQHGIIGASKETLSVGLSTNQSIGFDDRDNEITLERRKPLQSTSYKTISDNDEGTYTMLIELHDVDIMDHPLMTEEQRVAKDIEQMIEVLVERQRSGIVDFLSRKIKALKLSYEDFKKNMMSPLAPAAETIDASSGANNGTHPTSDGIFPAKPAHASFYSRHTNSRKTMHDEADRENEIQEKRRIFMEEIRATRLLRVRSEFLDFLGLAF